MNHYENSITGVLRNKEVTIMIIECCCVNRVLIKYSLDLILDRFDFLILIIYWLINSKKNREIMNLSISTMTGKTKFKIVLLGNQAVGKSSIIERYIHDKFD
jgi:hypothetical protein